MKSVLAIVASVFALSAFAADAPKAVETAKPAVATPAKKDTAKPAKSDAPASKEAPKATTK